MRDLHQLDLVELVLADHAARVLAVGTGLAAETRRVADELERQLLAREDLAAHEIRHRIFGGRNQVQIASLELEQIVLELGEAGNAVGALGGHHVRHVDLGVAVLLRVHVEHELRERAMQARDAFLQHRKTRAGQFRRSVEIELAEAGAQIDVVLHRKIKRARRADAPHFDVVIRRFAGRHARVRQVGDDGKKRVEFRLHRGEVLLERFQFVRLRIDFRHQRGRILALGFRLPDLLR